MFHLNGAKHIKSASSMCMQRAVSPHYTALVKLYLKLAGNMQYILLTKGGGLFFSN